MKNILKSFIIIISIVILICFVPYKILNYINTQIDIFELGSNDISSISGKMYYLINSDTINSSDRQIIIEVLSEFSKLKNSIKMMLTYVIIYLQIVILLVLIAKSVLSLVKKDKKVYAGVSFAISSIFLVVSIILNLIM